jgi:hypothetical protein
MTFTFFLSTICDFLFAPYKTIGDMEKGGPRKVDEVAVPNLVEMLRMAMEDLDEHMPKVQRLKKQLKM